MIMTQDDKDLLLRDLCGRLPYGIICEDGYGNVLGLNGINKPNTITFKCSDKTFWTTDLDKCKPYLFPLSSITEEQKDELVQRKLGYYHSFDNSGKMFFFELGYELYDWLNANHFDYRNLIGKNLAIDCTNLNIY